MENYEKLLNSQVFDDIEEEIRIATEMHEMAVLWDTTDVVTKSFYDISLSRITMANEALDTRVPLPVYDMYQGDTLEDAISLTVEGFMAIITKVLNAISTFIKWILGIIFKAESSHKKTSATVNRVDKDLSKENKEILDTVRNLDMDKYGTYFSNGKIYYNNSGGVVTKEVKLVIKVLNNLLSTSIALLPKHFKFNVSSKDFKGFIKDYTNSVETFTGIIPNVTDNLINFTNIINSPELVSSQDADFIDSYIDRAISNSLKPISDIWEVDSSQYPEVAGSDNSYPIMVNTGKYTDTPPFHNDVISTARIAFPLKSVQQNVQGSRADSLLHHRNMLISQYDIKEPFVGYYSILHDGYKDKKLIVDIMSSLLGAKVSDINALDKAIKNLNKVSSEAGGKINKILKEAQRQVDKDIKTYKRKILPKNGIVRYHYLFAATKMLSYWYLTKMGTTRTLTNKARGLSEKWVV